MEQLAQTPEGRDFNGYVLRSANIDPDATILDLGCGEGTDIVKIVSSDGLNHQGPVIGLEIPPHDSVVDFDERFFMLEAAMKQLGKGFAILKGRVQGPIPVKPGEVGVIEGYAQAIPLPDESVDVVFAGNSLQHVKKRQQPRALSEIYRVLKPGGKIIVIENAKGNKRKFHESLNNMGIFLGSDASGPISAKFDFDRAKAMLRGHYINPAYITLDDVMRITPAEVTLVGMSADTYRVLFRPYPHEDWDEAKQRFLIGPIWDEIAFNKLEHGDEAAYDELHRGAVIAQKPFLHTE